MIAEAFAPSFGALGIGGVIAFVAGSVMLMDAEVEGYEIYWPIVVAVAVAGAVSSALIGGFAMRARQRPVTTGQEEMIGLKGRAMEAFEHEGRVWVHSEEWRARSKVPIAAEQAVRVTGLDGLVLLIEPFTEES